MKVILTLAFLFTISVFSFNRKAECTKAINLLSSKEKYINLTENNKKLLKTIIDTNLKLQKEKKAKDLLNCINEKILTEQEIICVNKADTQYKRNKCLSKNTITKTREELHNTEIKLLKELVKDIDKNESSFKKTKKLLTKDKYGNCTVTLFKKNNINVKIIKNCSNKTQKTEFKYYLMIMPRNNNKIIYSSFVKKVKGKVIKSYNEYNIGAILKGREIFGKILNNDGSPVKKDIAKIEAMMETNYINSAY